MSETNSKAAYYPPAMLALAKVMDAQSREEPNPQFRANKQELAAKIRQQVKQDSAKG